ncbi:MAG: DUF4339 domain-containing protein [Planctomyces sp.]|nr:DUF4339 domain-containing protein [Planctomyces sp.]
MSKQWFYQAMGAAVGPMTSAELKHKVQHGAIQPDTLVRLGTDGKWLPADRVKGLLDPGPAPQPAAKTGAAAKAPATIPAAPSPAPAAAALAATPPAHGHDHARTYRIVGEAAHDDDIDEEDSGEYDFFRFVGFEQAIGERLYRVFCEYCHKHHLTMTEATRMAIASLLGRTDLLAGTTTAAAETQTELSASDTSEGLPLQKPAPPA